MRQIAEQQRFQVYSPTYWDDDGITQPAEIDLSINQSIPVGMFVVESDTVCPPENAAKLATELGDMNTFYKQYAGFTGDNIMSMNTPEFIQDLENFLTPTS